MPPRGKTRMPGQGVPVTDRAELRQCPCPLAVPVWGARCEGGSETREAGPLAVRVGVRALNAPAQLAVPAKAVLPGGCWQQVLLRGGRMPLMTMISTRLQGSGTIAVRAAASGVTWPLRLQLSVPRACQGGAVVVAAGAGCLARPFRRRCGLRRRARTLLLVCLGV